MEVIKQLVIDDNDIVFYPMMGNSYQLGGVAKAIILLIKRDKSKEEIIQLFSEVYEISEHELFIDINDFFTKLKIYGLYQ